jgi:hypothetical protein
MRKYRLSAYLLFVVILAIFALGSSITILLTPGIRFATPEAAVQSYWNAFNKQNLERASLSFSEVRLIDAPLVAQGMWRTNIRIDSIQILEKTVLDEHLVHLKYAVFLKERKRQFTTGDVMSYDDTFGWRIAAPSSDPPK